MAREYFCAYHSYTKAIELLNDAERGRLFAALLEYSETGIAPELRGNERFAFSLMSSQIDRDKEKYEEICEKRRNNGQKGGIKQKQANATKSKQKQANAPQGKEKDKGKDKEEGERKEKDTVVSTKKEFAPPTKEDVTAYCIERKNSVDPIRFWDYFNASNWIDSKGNPVQNWKQKIITWEKREDGTNRANAQSTAIPTRNTSGDRPIYGNVV